MILVALIAVPLVGGLLAWAVAGRSPGACRWIALGAMVLDLVLALLLVPALGGEGVAGLGGATGGGEAAATAAEGAGGRWLAHVSWEWIPRFGIGLTLGVDGLSLLLVFLTAVLGILAVAGSWSEITHRTGFFHFNLLWILAGVIGVFLALDLFLFYFFWELMLVPMYFLIGIWGHERRIYAALKFFLFTQASGLLMLVAILALAAAHAGATGAWSFAYADLLANPVAGPAAAWLMLGFVVAFVVKLPAVPFHTWLPDAHTEAPTAGSVVLAGLLLKTGGYGLIRFAVPLFPEAAEELAPAGMALGAVGVLYGAMLAFAQTDLKRLVAYSSVSHLGFVLLGVYAWNELALQGVVLQMVCHGLSTGALFLLVGQLQERTGTRDMDRLGGLWEVAPRMGGLGLFFALASLGLPGLGNFVAEFLVLVGAWRVSVVWTAVAAAGLILATVYSLWIVQRVYQGGDAGWRIPDLGVREVAILAVAVVGLVWLGLYPQPVIDAAAPVVRGLTAIPVEPAAEAAVAAAGGGAP
ncbi:MAG: NuoM family protein [Thermoanaerobaculia bacterium]